MMETGLAYGAVQATVRQECAMDVSKAEYVPGKRQHIPNPLFSHRETIASQTANFRNRARK
jgi:hypothetical protein